MKAKLIGFDRQKVETLREEVLKGFCQAFTIPVRGCLIFDLAQKYWGGGWVWFGYFCQVCASIAIFGGIFCEKEKKVSIEP